MTTGDQTRMFLAMTLCGAGAGAVHDLLRVLRHGAILTAIADLLLGFFLSAGMIGVGLKLGCDPFRLYALAGVFVGWMIYSLSLGTIVRILTQTIESVVKKSYKLSEKSKNHAGK
ncbi:MAG: spore cortex biosynthesis protein YabQ [Clostridia bacterium]|nr:spore cortex biosynthesis protein YabQ [Clostridia bacterium]